jgi:hypothetical protein
MSNGARRRLAMLVISDTVNLSTGRPMVERPLSIGGAVDGLGTQAHGLA